MMIIAYAALGCLLFLLTGVLVSLCHRLKEE